MELVDEEQPPDVLTSDTDNATFIHPSEARPHEREKYRRFRAYNTGLWNGPKRENKEAVRRQDNLHRYDAISSQLDLTPYQKQRGRAILDDIDLRATGKPLDHVAFAVCVVVANADAEGKRYWPHAEKRDNDPIFAEMGGSLSMSIGQQLSAVMVVKQRTTV